MAGVGTYGGVHVVDFHVDCPVTVGRYCSIGKDVLAIAGGEHRTDWVTTYPVRIRVLREKHANLAKGPIAIGNDVWIGQGARFLSGVTVGDGACIGAYAVVASDVPPYAIVAGNPARLLRYRFTAEQREALLAIRWWDWPAERIGQWADLLCSPDVDRFIARCREEGYR